MTKSLVGVRVTGVGMILVRQVAELVASPCSAQSSPLILSSLFCSFLTFSVARYVETSYSRGFWDQ